MAAKIMVNKKPCCICKALNGKNGINDLRFTVIRDLPLPNKIITVKKKIGEIASKAQHFNHLLLMSCKPCY